MIDDVLSFLERCSEADLRKAGTVVNRRIREFNSNKTTKTVVKSYTQWAYKSAELIYKNAKDVYPLTKEPDLVAWAVELDNITRLDKIPQEVVEVVMVHALQDKFWKNQVRSPGALRRHFEKIYMNGKANFDQQAAKRPKVYKV